MRIGIAVLALAAAGVTWAQAGEQGTPRTEPSTPASKEGETRPAERPSDEAIFGTTPPPTPPAEKAPEGAADEERQRLAPGIRDRFAEEDDAEDPLDIGGLFYQRFSATNRQNTSFSGTALSAPTLVDAYFDARPNDRVRAMVVARMQYDATLAAPGTDTGAALGGGAGGETSTSGSTTEALGALLGGTRANPSVTLDQLWLRFDVLRTVFVTLGKQHVKWGAARFWNPTDFLHPARRDALALFDVRTGVTMAKLTVPWEAIGSNFSAIGLFDNFGNADTLGELGGAFRAEFVLGNAEFGADAVVQRGQRPRYGIDLSSALGPFDVYGEAALRAGPYSRWIQTTVMSDGGPRYDTFESRREGDYSIGAAAGANWTFAYTDNDTATVGAEYFYNPSGYDNPEVYPWLIFNGEFQPFYTGQRYVGAYLLLAAPGSWDKTSFILSTLGNLSDRSFVSRLDFTVRVLTHLTVEANVSAFYGTEEGEFRLGLKVPQTVVNGIPIPAFEVPAQRLQLGLGLRLDI
jgi:hypothetical protein